MGATDYIHDWIDMGYAARDWFIDHYSTLEANRGQLVKLAVTEYDPRPGATGDAPIVLMVGGRSVPAEEVFSGWGGTYQWAQSLTKSGIHVFFMDFQGLGDSTRPVVMDDVINADRTDLPKLYGGTIPGPPTSTLPYSYPHHLTDSSSEIAELCTVLNWIATRLAGPIHLVGYSGASFIVGRCAMEWPEMVASLFLCAPAFPPWGLSEKPANPVPELFGFPLKLQGKKETLAAWNFDKRLGAEREGYVEDMVWERILEHDPKGAEWGRQVGGVIRYPTRLWWGWNDAKVRADSHLGNDVRVAIVYGTSDTQVITRRPDDGKPVLDIDPSPRPEKSGPPFDCRRLYPAIQGGSKLEISIDKTGHFMQWEKQAEVLHRYTADWITKKSIENKTQGRYHRDSSGGLVSVP
ncbi:alpha/beta hydrolase [Micromonospora sp. AP08]|uniref:alpha/beta hydrolase n=1 Tax=Micromonospora sp. AP08 TaxID=2604467 RepID=UPI0011D4A984|nr:alpha/beta hydrolase [Micromonospora sp. AP08]TYB39654.1 alpha/beta hydrolase [Micromonospora sp. AP08]